ncbi:uncharacterized protein LOC107491536 isoform X1 [Arachis duranensis]|uniref:peptidylprolyl isomerase n=1 Tax=Arachis duranensis TaxID=130453 RepID=A0A6P4DGC4_ARADU|nr:uncharacterized protein LOC107491536 isoform X1 [Arachis duranensis]XP_057762040.1 uncharacterized protein LOC130982175 isoform X1 [Arachis stenosperma]XP_057762041.1 uncharacterized protein LOC130982175 isoform X1 [Arachis stenosperma]
MQAASLSQTFIVNPTPQLQVARCKQRVDEFIIPTMNFTRLPPSWKLRHAATKREHVRCLPNAAVLSDAEITSAQFEEFSVSKGDISDSKELKISIKVSGSKTQQIFDDVFGKMVAAAQPIPGFRRVKGGKTPNIPKEILLEVLGPSRVYKEVIKKIINSTVAEYVEKERLMVSTNLRVEQSFEDLKSTFEEGQQFSFDAVVQLQK